MVGTAVNDSRQMGLFDPAAGEAAATAAIQQVAEAADEDWMQAAMEAVERAARKYPLFTTDHVWSELKTGCSTHERRAMGAVMRLAATAGVCRITDHTIKSGRVTCHRRPLRVWRSLYFGETP